MSVRNQISNKEGVYFITFTCAKWIPLFEITKGYHSVYKWFDYLKQQGHFIVGYVIMPNHVHAIIAFRNTEKSINSIVSNGKRFMAYELIKLLQQQNNHQVLDTLNEMVNATDKQRNKKHEVFEPSFDRKECKTIDFIKQKLDYLHENPVRYKTK
jgi:REP element-mobilizing transposase RayT